MHVNHSPVGNVRRVVYKVGLQIVFHTCIPQNTMMFSPFSCIFYIFITRVLKKVENVYILVASCAFVDTFTAPATLVVLA